MSAPKLTDVYNVMLLKAGWSTRTNRFYPKKALHRIQSQFTNPSLGEFLFSGDETPLRLRLDDVSHRTNRLYLKNDGTELWAEVNLLDTLSGRVVRDLYKTRNIRFDCLLTGKMNQHDEVEPDSVQFLRVIAYGVY